MAKLKYKDKDGFWQELPVGGEKLYNHSIEYVISENDSQVYIDVITSSSTPFTQFSEFKWLINYRVASIAGPAFCGAALVVATTNNEVWIRGGGAMGSDTTTYVTIDKKVNGSNFTDTVKER